MILIYALFFVTLFSLIFTKSIKKNSWIYYLISSVIAIITTVYEILRITSNAKIYGTILYLEKLSMRGYISIAFFILVMFAGALKSKWWIAKKVLSIRAELAIIASIFILPHCIMFSVRFFLLKLPNILKANTIPKLYISYLIIGAAAFIIMLPLFITSIKAVRRKMRSSLWKRIQRYAYIFYFLSYVHILLVLLNEKEMDWLRLGTYSIIFGSYTILRIIKHIDSKQTKLNFTNRLSTLELE